MDKKTLRAQFLKKRAALDEKYLQKANDTLTERTITLITKKHWKKIGIFLGIHHEVETIKIINFCLDRGIEIYLPYCDVEEKTMTFKLIHQIATDLEKNEKLNIFQPRLEAKDLSHPNDLDVLFVPVVAFDDHLQRIGRGAGYYDRWIANNHFQKPKIGLAFSMQKSPEPFAVSEHDQSLDYYLTEKTSLISLLKHKF